MTAFDKILPQLKNKRGQNFFIYGAGQAFNLVTPLLILPYIISKCGEDGLGKVATGFALALFLILIVDYAFEIKGTKKVSERRHDLIFLQELVSITLLTKLVLFIIVTGICILGVTLVPALQAEKKLFFFSLAVVVAQVFNPVWFLQGIEDFKTISFIIIVSKVLYVLLVYSFVNSTNDYVYVNLYLGLSSLITNTIGLIYTLARNNISLSAPPAKNIVAVLKNDFSFCISQLFLSIRQLSPLVLTGIFLGYTIAGQYKLIEQILTLFRTYTQVLLRYFYPAVCYKIYNNIVEGFRFWKQYSAYNVILTAFFASWLFLFSDEVLRFFNATPSTVGEISSIFRISLIIPVQMSFSLAMEQLMLIVNRNKIYIAVAISVAIINVLLILLLIEKYKITGIIISIIIAEMLFILIYYNTAYRHTANKIKHGKKVFA